MKVADQRNFATGVFYVVFGAVVALAASRYPIGSIARMGPGYFPFAAGLALGIVGLCLIGLALRRGASNSTIGGWSGKNVAVVLLSIVLFGVLLERLGLFIALPALLALSSRAHSDFSRRSLLLSIVVLLVATWAIFVLLLGLPFPMLPPFLSR